MDVYRRCNRDITRVYNYVTERGTAAESNTKKGKPELLSAFTLGEEKKKPKRDRCVWV